MTDERADGPVGEQAFMDALDAYEPRCKKPSDPFAIIEGSTQ